jgi:hypothetical protein
MLVRAGLVGCPSSISSYIRCLASSSTGPAAAAAAQPLPVLQTQGEEEQPSLAQAPRWLRELGVVRTDWT